jgi:hypothetical protein
VGGPDYLAASLRSVNRVAEPQSSIPVDVATAADLYHRHRLAGVVNGEQDAIVALPQPVLLFARQLFGLGGRGSVARPCILVTMRLRSCLVSGSNYLETDASIRSLELATPLQDLQHVLERQ